MALNGVMTLMLRYFPKFLYNVVLKQLLECGPMPSLMAALQNIGGALCSTPQFG